MNTTQSKLGEGQRSSQGVRIIWAIATKDIVDALRNKTTLSIMVGVAFMMLLGMALPLLLGLKDIPTAVVYDPGQSTLIKALTARDEFRLRLVESQEEIERVLTSSPNAALGLVIPAEYRQAAGSGGAVEIQGYYAHWADSARVASLATLFEGKLGEASWQTVHINTEGHVVYPAYDGSGQLTMFSLSTSIILMMMGFSLVPLLMVEEKETHTFDALLVSPASLSQVVIGKAIAGSVYCLVAAAVVFAFNAKLIVHWEVVILAALLGAAFAVAVGLLMGALFDTPATLGLWTGLLAIVLVVPTVFGFLTNAKVPAIVQTVIPWIPSVALSKLLTLSMAGNFPAAALWTNTVALLGAALIVYVIVVWRVRRADR